MATWKAKCWLGTSNGYQNLTVQSNTFHGAKEQLERIYGATQVINLRQVRETSCNNDSTINIGGLFSLVLLVGSIYSFVMWTPWVLMGLGGAFGTWIGEKITDQTVQEYIEYDDASQKRMGIVLILALIVGGFGFVQGDKIHQEYFSETIEEVRNAE